MASNGKYGSNPYAPSAPSLPESYGQQQQEPQYYSTTSSHTPPASSYYGQQGQQYSQYGSGHGQGSSSSSYGQSSFPPGTDPAVISSFQMVDSTTSSHSPPASNYYGQQGQQYSQYGSGYGQSSSSSYGQSGFPPGTDPAVISSFQMVDKDRSGFIDENELQQALSSGYQRFSLRTVRLLMFLFKNPNGSLRVGPKEFAALWSCLGEWRTIFQRYDRDRSGKIDLMELRDALYGLGLAVPPSVLQLLISMYEDGSGRRVELSFDSFVECGMIVKGLTEKFKEKDPRYTGSATFSYDAFMSMVIPFLVSYN